MKPSILDFMFERFESNMKPIFLNRQNLKKFKNLTQQIEMHTINFIIKNFYFPKNKGNIRNDSNASIS